MKKFEIIASQTIYYRKTIEAETEKKAEELAWEDDNGDDWKDFAFGDWEFVDIKEKANA